MSFVFAIDQGTSSSRTLVCNDKAEVIHIEQQDFDLIYPENGWVEQCPDTLFTTVLKTYLAARASFEPCCIGITNQRETTIVWRRDTGEPIYNAIVWQDRRTQDFCEELKEKGVEQLLVDTTGLMIDPYFSASKIAWILDNVDGAREMAERGELMFGTVDTWILYRLTNGEVHATDATNASRTQLFDIHTQQWSEPLCNLFNVPMSMLPKVLDSADNYGRVSTHIDSASPAITAMIGDQQAALVGQRCFKPGQSKSTFGTGSFLMVNTGTIATQPDNGLLTTVAYRINGQPYYAIEGAIFMAGASVQWLRDSLQVIDDAPASEALAREANPHHQVILVPAFTGLGAPHWAPNARAAIFGLTRDAGRAEITAATLEASAFQTLDLLEAINAMGQSCEGLTIDGGMSANRWFCQALADICQIEVRQSDETEGTAIGAAILALWQGRVSELAPPLQSTCFEPSGKGDHPRLSAWRQAIGAIPR